MTATTLLADMSQCQPADCLERGYRHGTWRLIDYETTEFAGTMVYSGPGMQSPALTLPLQREGLHAIHLGVHYPEQGANAHLCVRLTGDDTLAPVWAERPYPKDVSGMPEELKASIAGKHFSHWQVSEVFWKVADLTGQELVLSRSDSAAHAGLYSNLVHVRLVPLSAAPGWSCRCRCRGQPGGGYSEPISALTLPTCVVIASTAEPLGGVQCVEIETIGSSFAASRFRQTVA